MNRLRTAAALTLLLVTLAVLSQRRILHLTKSLSGQILQASSQSEQTNYSAAEDLYASANQEFREQRGFLAFFVKRTTLDELAIRLSGMNALNAPETQKELLRSTQELLVSLDNLKMSAVRLF